MFGDIVFYHTCEEETTSKRIYQHVSALNVRVGLIVVSFYSGGKFYNSKVSISIYTSQPKQHKCTHKTYKFCLEVHLQAAQILPMNVLA